MREDESVRATIVNEVITGCKCKRMKCGMEGQMQGRLESPKAASERTSERDIYRKRQRMIIIMKSGTANRPEI